MEKGKLDPGELSFVSGHSLDERVLLKFYEAMYPGRAEALARVWRWLSRPGFWDKTGPLVVLCEGRLVGHLGLVPFRAVVGGNPCVVTRSTDFAVLPEVQRHGLGILLLRKWMEMPDVQIGFPNERAIGTCRKLKWLESTDSYLHFYLLRPLDHPRSARSVPPVLRGVLNTLSGPFLSLLYRPHASGIRGLVPAEPSPDSIGGLETGSLTESPLVQPVHDRAYLTWRFVDSPERPKYRIFNVQDLTMAVRLCDRRDYRYIDLLCVSPWAKGRDVRTLLSTLAVWGLREGYSFIRYYTKDKSLSAYLRRSLRGIVRRTHFIFHSPDKSMAGKLTSSTWHLELADGDFEEF